MGTFYTWGEQLSYYPEQAPMDAPAPAPKIAGGQLQEEVLEWFNYPPTQDTKLAARDYRITSARLLRNFMSLADHKGA